MELKDDLQLSKDYHLLSLPNWTKLRAAYGGGPEIPFFSYQKEVKTIGLDGLEETVRESQQDFHPIRVRVHIYKR